MKRYIAYGLLLTVSLVFAVFLIVDWRQYETGLEHAIKPADNNYENSESYVSDRRMIDVIVKLTAESPATFGTRLKSAQRIDEKRVHVNTNKLEGIIELKDIEGKTLVWRVLDNTSNHLIIESKNWGNE
ncbi:MULTISPECIES: hypothetical protein [Priestia]|jgi:hypothetical protein|uniref:hypothetical protein n=1 Tax=Priestia TaxID=2800373 RepID=UPI001C8EADE6|nr:MULTISPECIES: hypothetical protein [Priestia]MBX9996397.1 hypothetical protein [Priestia aryabhattai]MCP1447884.1 hypothetical protein [Priestia megaterium]MED4051826.1 hypothetical protein [Priestia megaterium]MED4059262.1 hypothetical protein [Priestia megaterium]WJD79529.1 hypothetical protein QRD24_18805 [Priestia megaterium]